MDILVEFVQIIIRLIMTLLLFRFLMQWSGVSFYNPVAEMIVRFSEPFTKALRLIVPRSRRYDWSSLLAMLLLATAFWLIYFAIIDAGSNRFGSVFTRSLGSVLNVALTTLLFTLIIRIISSWFAVNGINPALDFIHQLTDPILLPFRRIIPQSGGFDFSPLIPLLIIWFALRILQEYFLI